MVRDRSHWVRRLILAGAIALALGYVPHHLYGRTGLGRLLRLQRELRELGRRNEAVRIENVHLQAEAAALKSDPRAIERVARDELGLVKPGEVIYQLEPDSPP